MTTPETYNGTRIDMMSEVELIKALNEISSKCEPYYYMLANELLNELKWCMQSNKFEEFKKDLLNKFPEFYGEKKEIKVISLTDRNLTEKILNRKRPDFTKLVLENTKSF